MAQIDWELIRKRMLIYKYQPGYFTGGVAPEDCSNWILYTGLWNDSGVWGDSCLWDDGVAPTTTTTTTIPPTTTTTTLPPTTTTTTTQAPSLVTTNLTNYFDANNSSSYSGTGTTWFNLVSGGSNATLFGSPTFNSGTPDYFDFSLTNGARAGYTHSATASYTICAWVKSVQNANLNVFVTLGETGLWGMEIEKSDNNYFTFRVLQNNPPEERVLQSNTVLQDNVWYYVCASIEPSNINATNNQKIYINGQLSAQRSSTVTQYRTGGRITIGYLDDQFNLGDVDVSIVQIYDRVLSESEILQNYNYDKTIFGH